MMKPPFRLLGAFLAALALVPPFAPATSAEPPALVPSADERAVAAAMAEIVQASMDAAAPSPFRTPLRGELAETHPSGFGRLSEQDRVVLIDRDQAVARVPAQAQLPDLYFYLDRQAGGDWRATAVRSLALPPFIRMIRDGLGSRTDLTADDQALLANVELATRSDRELRAWFDQNRPRLERIAVLGLDAAGQAERSLAGTPAEPELKGLHLSSGTVAADGTVTIIIGGVMDDSVGLMRPSDRSRLPSMSRDAYIWIEELQNGWFLFRTT